MRVRIRATPRVTGTGAVDHAAPILSPLPRGGGRMPLAMTLSLALHLAGGAAAPAIWDALDGLSRPVVDFRQAVLLKRDAMPLVVRVPEEPLLVRMPKLAERPKLKSLRARMKAVPEVAARAKPRKPAGWPLKRDAPVATAVLLQPRLQLARIEDVPDLRTLAVWTGRSPKPVAQPVVVGQVKPSPESGVSPKVTLPAWPSPEPVRSELTAALVERPVVVRPKLVLPPSGSSPLAAPVRLEEPVIPPGSSMAGEAAAILALSSLSARPDEVLPVPAGNLVVVGSGGASSPVEGPKAEPALPAVSPAAANPVVVASRKLAGGIQLEESRDGTVSLSYPGDGQFDVVVVEAALPEAVAQFERSLSGRPVHTAFINVGTGVEWVLQYCVAGQATGPAAQQGMVVTLDAPRPLKAPYVLRAMLPAEAAWREAGYVVVHGVLSALGRLEQLSAVRGGAAAATLVGALGQWLFRPASEGGVARSVEVLLVVPPGGRVKSP